MTYIKTDTDHHSSISIHLPTRRTILLQRWLTPYSSRFQLTSSRRGWRQQANTQSWHWNFNSHPHEEDDGRNPSSHNDAEYFNSHPHEEDDVLHCVIGDIKNHFNSHPHEEDDPVPSVTPPFFNISTHILTKRMTCKYVSTSGIEIFQLTSSRRGWPRCQRVHHCGISHFNSHPHEEDDGKFQRRSSRRGHFNSHPHEEDDAE